jgi:hypothetical protein
MSSTDTTAAAPAAAPAAATNAINAFFTHLGADWQILEEDVIVVIQNIGAGIAVAANDIAQGLGWLGSHIGQVATTVTAVQASVNSLTAAGVPIPVSLVNGLASMNQAVAGVNEALNNDAVATDASTALKNDYSATKALQVAAASAASIAAAVQAATVPATPAASTAS